MMMGRRIEGDRDKEKQKRVRQDINNKEKRSEKKPLSPVDENLHLWDDPVDFTDRSLPPPASYI